MKNEIKHGIELEKEIAEKKRNLLKTVEDIEKVKVEKDIEDGDNQRYTIQNEKMHHNGEGLPQVILIKIMIFIK